MRFQTILTALGIVAMATTVSANVNQQADDILAKMTLDQKIGQVFMIGVSNHFEVPQAQIAIQKKHIGGILLYSRNLPSPSQLKTSIKQLQRTSKRQSHQLPLLVAVDQEGGSVSRLKSLGKFPSSLALGAANSEALAYAIGALTGQELREIGINMNLAPVLDINTTQQNTVIGDRAYSDNPDTVAKLGRAYITGLQSQNVIATAKHFPGHGSTTVDSHKQLPVMNAPKLTLDYKELLPFREAINAGVKSVMTAHVIQNQIDGSSPASLSKSMTTTLLRQDLNFNGLIITDDLSMKAISSNWDTKQIGVLALLAGSDIILTLHFPHEVTEMQKYIKTAIQSGVLKESQLDAAVKRIIIAKLNQAEATAQTETPKIDRDTILSDAYESAVCTLQVGEASLPISKKTPIWVSGTAEFLSQIRPELPEVASLDDAQVWITEVKTNSGVKIVNDYIAKHEIKVIAIVTGSPYIAQNLDPRVTSIIAFGSHPTAITKAGEIITGASQALGNWPYKIGDSKMESKGN